MSVSLARSLVSVLFSLVVLLFVPTGPSLAEEFNSRKHGDYHRRHILELAIDKYRGRQKLPNQWTVESNTALRQLAAASRLPCSVTWIGHSTFLLRVGGLSILTDPIYSSHASPLPPLGPRRLAAPGIRMRDLPRINAVILSHSHYDHADFPTLQGLARRDKRTVVFAPESLSEEIRRAGFSRVVPHQPGQRSRIGPLRLTSIAVQHRTGRDFHGHNHGNAQCWRLDSAGVRMFFCGDTSYGPEFIKARQTLGKTDIALLPIGAYTPRWFERRSHVDPVEAVRIGQDLGADTIIAGHWGTFALTPEPVLDPPRLFMKVPSPGIDKVALKIGETYAPVRHCR